MSLFLTIDQGNSAAKMALWEGSELLKVSIEEHLSIDDVARFIAPATRVELVLYCSVAGRGQELVAGMAAMARKVVRLRSDMRLPLVIDYGTPGTLGVDRIAAAVGAMALYPSTSLLVVDAGTAVTYDAVSADGHFMGGNIAPGINMRLEALHRFTARLPRVKAPRELNPEEFLGHDTASAMVNGAVWGVVGAITYYLQRLPAQTRVVMTGGWARVLSKLCNFEVTVESNLVSIGLNRIILFNENENNEDK